MTHHSALAYWQSRFSQPGQIGNWRAQLPSDKLDGRTIDFERMERLGFGPPPLHVTIADLSQRTQVAGVRCHILKGPVPKGAFMLVKPDIWVSSPELCFVQLAAELSFPAAVHLGFELCARYRINEFLDEPEPREPLTSARALRDFSARFGNHRGARMARIAAQYVSDHAESPKEVDLAMLLTLPRQYGGYGIPQATLNPNIVVARRKGGLSEYRGDLVWPKAHLIVEYESNQHHTGAQRIAEDSRRRNTLQDAGWHIITVTGNQLPDEPTMDDIAGQIIRKLGIRQREAPRQMMVRRGELFRFLTGD